ncbi:hypothetical protein BJ875DRAFT_488407 [Amylocarpus encephaloides]|uniref:MARVEL domain-containing protein n=1 Tax=Amylocarpus encephaloides TaxID=45428 RepID=A0A9P7YAA2_9HELO|nr:hypothetical protein BJ875DRAFT_488407 [Amylocarpus encephaloides]
MSDEQESLVPPPRTSIWKTRNLWLAVLRMSQLLVGFTAVCLAGFTAHVFLGDWFHTFTFTLFTFIWTIGFLAYVYITLIWFPKLYSYWAHLGLEIVTLIFWLASFSLLIWECQTWDGAQIALVDTLEPEYVAAINSLPKQDAAIAALRAATALTCVNWILFGGTLIVSGR